MARRAFPSFTWRGAVTAGQVLELRGILGTGTTSIVATQVDILTNKEL